jgi:hypothetical protein
MNRLSHIQKTLEQNIISNYHPGEAEFVLLDYNSTDGLEEWVKTLRSYIDSGILVYYRTTGPQHYHRSHSRNMVFRLSNAGIVCNLDADNFLGQGFAAYILNEFDKYREEKIFITSSYQDRNTFGRFCARIEDFLHVRGYNELLSGYGAEDLDIFDRMLSSGVHQKEIHNPSFLKAIDHPYEDRVSQEYRFKQLDSFYLSYESPFRVKFLTLYKNRDCESGSLINNALCNYNHDKHFSNRVELFYDGVYRIMFDSPLIQGKWQVSKNEIQINTGDDNYSFPAGEKEIFVDESIYYKITDTELLSELMMHLSDAINYATIKQIKNHPVEVNPNGFGQGLVYRNFDYNHPIVLY